MSIAFFHQNEVVGAQGGIQRYIATLMDQGKENCFLVTEEAPPQGNYRLCISLPSIKFLPKWMRFTWAVWTNVSKIREFLKSNNIKTLEFGRAEYALFAFLFPGKKVFTYHGTGPINTERMQRFVTSTFSWLVLLQADIVQIVGPDARALPRLIQKLLSKKINYVDAWYDDCFVPTEFPDIKGPIKMFFAGRLAPAKNPELMFAVAKEMHKRWGNKFEFHYFGADGNLIPRELFGSAIIDRGLQNMEGMAKGMATCHFGLLTSFFEGSPFVVIEGLACGRGFVLAPILGLLRTYKNQIGILFADNYSVAAFVEKIEAMISDVQNNKISVSEISQAVQHRSKKQVTSELLKKT